MRSAFALVLLVACTPDIAPNTYLCGPDGACPDGLACNGPDNRCVIASAAQPFECMPERETEPDNMAAEAFELMGLTCGGVSVPVESCMMQGDGEDWVKVTVPVDCTKGVLSARVDFPVAFERLGLEIYNIATNTKLAEDDECQVTGEEGEERRCAQADVTAGGSFGVRVRPAGDGNCDGNCSYNRYKLSVQLRTSL